MQEDSDSPEIIDDEELLRQSLEGVSPLRRTEKAVLDKRKPAPVPVQRIADDAQVLADSISDQAPLETGLETGDELVFLRDGLSNQTLKKLRRGNWAVQDHLDLHGLHSAAARDMLVQFLNEALNAGIRCVRVVHGKGYRSRNQQPVLKRRIAGWLQQRDEVLAYCQAPQADGGSGAVLILLKSRRRPRAARR